MADIKFEIKRLVGALSTKENGWRKELNIVSWADRQAKYEIREWNEDHTRMTRGITLTDEEARNLYEILAGEFRKEK